MSFCATSLVTRGYISPQIVQDQIVSLDEPEIVMALEVKPAIIGANAVVQELRPVILKAEEE